MVGRTWTGKLTGRESVVSYRTFGYDGLLGIIGVHGGIRMQGVIVGGLDNDGPTELWIENE